MSTQQLDQFPAGNGVQPWQGLGGVARASAAALGVYAVTPSNTVDLPPNSIGLWVGGAGTVAVTMWDGSTATLSGVAAGTLLPLSVRRVNTASTATLIVALY